MPLSMSRCVATLFAFYLPLATGLAPASAEDRPAPLTAVTGVVLDASGAVVPGATVTLRVAGRRAAETVSDGTGRFQFAHVALGPLVVSVRMDGFSTATVEVPLGQRPANLRVVLTPLGVSQRVTVRPESGPGSRTVTATKTDTPLRDVPQAVSVITRETIAAQGMQNLADLVRYVPGVGMAQGEGNRDAAIFRGNSSTADFFVDGVRDDVQYYRDLYNVERVEVLKGANAMMFGRGGTGGVLNRVTREATWNTVRELTLQAGSYGNRRATIDIGQALSQGVAARLTGVYENSDSYRDHVGLERYGINPTLSATLGSRAMLTVGYERFHDGRTADRGIPSFHGRPVAVAPSRFFGDPDASESRANVDAFTGALQYQLASGVTVRNHTRYADYDKFYQNVYPSGVNANGTMASLSAYNNATTRRNIFSQTDLVAAIKTGPVAHTLLVGGEIGRQATANFRNTGYFGATGAMTISVPLDAPTVSAAATFRQSATDADNAGVAHVRAVYVQDQAELTPFLRVVAGLRYETFEVDFHNTRTPTDFRSVDHLLSPRLGVIVKPAETLSLYSSYSLAYQPRAGDQLSSLTLSNQALDPEQFRNYEAGAKWDARSGLSVTTAVYQLDRRNVAVPDPVNPARMQLVSGQRTRGVEIEATGRLNAAWTLVGGYAFQQGEITNSLSPTAQAGARLAQLPAHSFALWNKYDINTTVGAAVGVIRRGEVFTSTDNLVVLPAFTRVDGALFLTFTKRVRMQANLENLLNVRYYASANGNNNITPGSPRALRVTLTTGF